jgi:MFS superfamily sulfate permease-like transporter
MTSSTYKWIFIVTGALLLLAIADMPWGYYQAIRWIVVLAGILLVLRALEVKQSGWTILGGLSTVFFFPPFGVSFEKEIWALFDLAFGVAFILAGTLMRKNSIKK